MSLYGIIKTDLTLEIVNAVSRQLIHFGADDRRISGADWAIGVRGEKDQIATLPDGSHLAFYGRLHNREEIAGHFQLSIQLSDSEITGHALLISPDKAAALFKGDFVLAHFQPMLKRLLLLRDKVGARPVYYMNDGKFIAFATETKALLPLKSVQPNGEGLSAHLLHGHAPPFSYGATCFSGIEVLPPAHELVWQNHREKIRRYWDFSFQPELQRIDFHEASDEFSRLFRQATLRRSHGLTAVSVSGGLDSSSIYCSLLRERVQAVGLSYFSNRAEVDETKYLIEIEKLYGVEIERLNMDPLAGIEGTLAEQVRIVEAPFVDYQWNVSIAMLKQAKSLGARTFLTGHFGDQVLFSWAYITDLIIKGNWLLAARHLREYKNWYEEDVTRLALSTLPKSLLRQILPNPLFQKLRTLNPWTPRQQSTSLRIPTEAPRPAVFHSEVFPTAQSRNLYTQARSRYHIQCLDWYAKIAAQTQVEVAFPMFDVDLLQFLISLPGQLQNFNGVPRAILRESLRDALPQSIANRTWKSDFSGIVSDSVKVETEKLTGLLFESPRMVKYGYVTSVDLRREVGQSLKRISPDDCTAAWDLVDFAAFEQWLRIFMDPKQETANEKNQEKSL